MCRVLSSVLCSQCTELCVKTSQLRWRWPSTLIILLSMVSIDMTLLKSMSMSTLLMTIKTHLKIKSDLILDRIFVILSNTLHACFLPLLRHYIMLTVCITLNFVM